MRTLSITRAKSFVACLGTFKVYIEDAQGDTIINGTSCRQLGKLKNGETQTFEIGEGEARVYVIADQLSKNYCNEYTTVPAGTESISLSGGAKLNPATGNAFRFDGVTDEAVLANRKKGSRKGLVVLIIAIIIGLIFGLFIGGFFA